MLLLVVLENYVEYEILFCGYKEWESLFKIKMEDNKRDSAIKTYSNYILIIAHVTFIDTQTGRSIFVFFLVNMPLGS